MKATQIPGGALLFLQAEQVERWLLGSCIERCCTWGE